MLILRSIILWKFKDINYFRPIMDLNKSKSQNSFNYHGTRNKQNVASQDRGDCYVGQRFHSFRIGFFSVLGRIKEHQIILLIRMPWKNLAYFVRIPNTDGGGCSWLGFTVKWRQLESWSMENYSGPDLGYWIFRYFRSSFTPNAVHPLCLFSDYRVWHGFALEENIMAEHLVNLAAFLLILSAIWMLLTYKKGFVKSNLIVNWICVIPLFAALAIRWKFYFPQWV